MLQNGLHLDQSDLYFNTLSDLVHCYKGDNPELPLILVNAPTELAGESSTVMSRVDPESLMSEFFLGGVPHQAVGL